MSTPETREKTKPAPVTGLALMREPFKANQISKLPKPYKKDSPKGNCKECGGYHGLPAVHLDYVGHAALTDRLLDVDPHWSWEPVADPASHGLPVAQGGMWIKLTICGVSRYGFGHPDGKAGGDAVKETIGDALRNAAMRFGAALDLWHKGDLHAEEAGEDEPKTPAKAAQREPEESAAVLAAGVAIDLCKTEAALSKWSATNAEMIANLDKDDKLEVRRLYGLRLEKLREAQADQNSRDPFEEAA